LLLLLINKFINFSSQKTLKDIRTFVFYIGDDKMKKKQNEKEMDSFSAEPDDELQDESLDEEEKGLGKSESDDWDEDY